LALFDPAWRDLTDAQIYAARRDQHRLYQFLMALRDDFEPIRGQLLHRSPLPTLDQAVCELVREETRLSTLRSQHTPHTHPVLAAPSPQTKHSDRSVRGPSKNRDNPFCRYCRRRGHTIDKCWRKAKSSTPAAAVTTTESASSSLPQLLPLATLSDLLSPYLQLTLRQLSTRYSLVLVMHLPLSSPFCQVNLPLGFLTPPAATI
jgi:hypothetical protein